METIKRAIKTVFTFRFKPSWDLAVVLASTILVTASLYIATAVITPAKGGGMPYFFMYAGATALLFGICLPLFWTVVVRKRSLQDLGITRKNLGLSLGLQVILAAIQFALTLGKAPLPPFEKLLPLIGLSLAIGFFEAIFWRGWVFQRIEESFGYLPAIILGSALYALYHIGYTMPFSEISFLFWIGVLYAVSFSITRSMFILWPLYQPLGQLVTLTRDGLSLPLIASLGFIEALAVMIVAIWLAGKYAAKRQKKALA